MNNLDKIQSQLDDKEHQLINTLSDLKETKRLLVENERQSKENPRYCIILGERQRIMQFDYIYNDTS